MARGLLSGVLLRIVVEMFHHPAGFTTRSARSAPAAATATPTMTTTRRTCTFQAPARSSRDSWSCRPGQVSTLQVPKVDESKEPVEAIRFLLNDRGTYLFSFWALRLADRELVHPHG
jgi:hypothetical protein